MNNLHNILKLNRLLDQVHWCDDCWSHELRRAFGKDACNRRYDADKQNHPENCRIALTELNVARSRFYAAGGYPALFGGVS